LLLKNEKKKKKKKKKQLLRLYRSKSSADDVRAVSLSRALHRSSTRHHPANRRH
jgi:hypothetical protein